MTQGDGESVLSRWSRRKLEAEKAAEQPVAAAVESSAGPAIQADADAENLPLLTDQDMPAVETLTEDSDFSGFMSEGVSDELRNLALRKLFRAPVFNIRDGLDEYDEDYTEFEKLGDIVTSDMKHRIEMQEQKRREKLAEEAELEAAAEGVEEDDIEGGDIEDGDIEDDGEPKQGIEMQDDNDTDRVEQVKATHE